MSGQERRFKSDKNISDNHNASIGCFFLQRQRMSKDFSFKRFLGLPILNKFSFYGKATIEEN